MTTFNDREKGFENKFAHDEEMQFKAVRPAQPAARPLGGRRSSARPATEADAYAMEVVRADFAEAATRTSSASSRPTSPTAPTRTTIRGKMAELLAMAKGQVLSELPPE